uniref:Uncharacterized protein n=1 Tax=Oryza punctata TaxID=4537 RepID=A0A0E0K2F6_ORYPU
MAGMSAFRVYFGEDMEEEWPYPLLSKEIDTRHRAKNISDGNSCSTLPVLISRTAGWWGIDPRWKPRLLAAGLLNYLHSDDAGKDETHGPTLKWLSQFEPQWARIQMHNVYEYFTESFESLRENEVR